MSSYNVTNPELTQYRCLIEKLANLPLWVRQAIYCDLKSNIASCSDIQLIESLGTKIVQLMKPKLTATAIKAMKTPDSNHNLNSLDAGQVNFIKTANNSLTMLEIAHKNYWSLKEAAVILLELTERNFIEPVFNPAALSLIYYISGRIRLGEFLVRTNRLTNANLDQALYSKKCAESLGSQVDFKEVLVNLGYMTSHEVESITSIKTSAEEKITIIDESMLQAQEIAMLQDQIDAVTFENQKLNKDLDRLKQQMEVTQTEHLELLKQVEKDSKGFMKRMLANFS